MKTIEHFYKTLPGYFTFEDFYAWIAKRVPEKARCVEVGVFAGRSAAFLGVELSRADKGATLDLVDQGFNDLGTDGIRRALDPIAHAIDQVHLGASWEAASFYADKSLDFVFLDAGHNIRMSRMTSLPGVRRSNRAGSSRGTISPGSIPAWFEPLSKRLIISTSGAEANSQTGSITRCGTSRCHERATCCRLDLLSRVAHRPMPPLGRSPDGPGAAHLHRSRVAADSEDALGEPRRLGF